MPCVNERVHIDELNRKKEKRKYLSTDVSKALEINILAIVIGYASRKA